MFVFLHPLSEIETPKFKDGSLAQLNRASDYGSEGCRFESCRSHWKRENSDVLSFFFISLQKKMLKKQLFRKKFVTLHNINVSKKKTIVKISIN